MELIKKYFPNLEKEKYSKIEQYSFLLKEWNSKINLISRKDVDNIEVNHILHSLSICKIFEFISGQTILDVGSGGGLPGIPLAIFFDNCEFTLIDSITKKTNVLNEMKKELNLNNIKIVNERVEKHSLKYDYIVSRAVTNLNDFMQLVNNNIKLKNIENNNRGVIYLKGGNIEEETKSFNKNIVTYNINDFFAESYFETKKIVFIKK